MKTFILICVIIVSLTFAACGYNTTGQESQLTLSPLPLNDAEKSQIHNERMVQSLQAIIETFDNVNDAVVSIDDVETQKAVEVFVTTTPDGPLTDEQKTGIENIIRSFFEEDPDITVDIVEEDKTGE